MKNEAIDNIGKSYVYSYKPSPAIFADDWDPDRVEKELQRFLRKAISGGCTVEIIMKDVSTVKYKPQHLWEWARVAVRAAENI